MSLQRKNNRSSSNLVISEPYDQRRWLQRRGKESRLLFSDKMKDRLKKYFLSLDEDGSETISSNELEDPLILFGLCQNRKEVNSLFSSIDFDGSGELQFTQFLEVFRRVKSGSQVRKICQIQKKDKSKDKYQQFTNTLMGMQNKIDTSISFRLGMSIYRRKNMIRAIVGRNSKQQEEGQIFIKKFEEQIKNNPITSKKLLEKKEEKLQFLPGLPNNPLRKHSLRTRRIKTSLQ